MSNIHDTITRASRRLFLIDLLFTISISAGFILGLMVLARGVQKLAPTVEIPWQTVFIIAPITAIVAGFIWSLIRKPSTLKTAQIVDEHANLRETISTALIIEDQSDGWSKSIITDANTKASKIDLNKALPIQAPKAWATPFVVALVLLGVWWLPVKDLTGLYEKKQQQQIEQAQIQEVQATVNESQETLKKILEETKIDLEDFDATEFEDLLKPESNEFISPEESLRSAIKNLTSVTDKLEAERNDEDGATFDAIKDAMKSLNSTEDNAASDMARAMARGDFEEAREKLQELAEQMSKGDMSQEDKDKLADQLENMKQQMEQMAQNSQSLQEQLQAAGLSEDQAKQLATDPNALEKALEDLGIPSDQQQALQQAAQAQQRATDAAGAMSQAMGQMAQGMQSGDQQQASQGAESMNAQLSNLENMQQEMQSLDNAMNQAQQQLDQLSQCSGSCENPGGQQGGGQQNQWPNSGQYANQSGQPQQGNGSGQKPGQGLGAGPDEAATDFTIKKEHADVRTTSEGPVIASTMVNGAQIRGESTASFSQAVTSAKNQASEAIETRQIPRKYEGAVKQFYGRLDKAAKDAQKNDIPKSDTPAEPTTESTED